MTKDLLRQLTENYPQYVPIMEYVEWNNSYVKETYGNRDMKMYWYTSLIDMRAIEKMIYAEGLILLYHDKLTYEYLEVACLRIILDKAKDKLLDILDIDNIRETIHKTYNHIMEHKEEILNSEKTWKPNTRFMVESHTHKKKLSNEEFIAMLDECKEMTGHRTYKCCSQYFVTNTGLNEKTFQRYVKKYNVVFDEKEERGGKKSNSGRKNPVWPDHIKPEEWKLSPENIGKLAMIRCPWIVELKTQAIKNWKYKKLKEMKN